MTGRECSDCGRVFRWLLDLYEHLVRDHEHDPRQLPAPHLLPVRAGR